MSRLRLIALLLVCCSVVQCQDPDDKTKTETCDEGDTIQLDGLIEEEDCGLVEGRVQFCEDGGSGERMWKHLCDDQFTEKDAKVICKSLGYSAISKYLYTLQDLQDS